MLLHNQTYLYSANGYPITATGGTITTYTLGGITYKLHTFTSDGTFSVSSGSGNGVEYFIVGGGGDGGSSVGGTNSSAGGGGGAGRDYCNGTCQPCGCGGSGGAAGFTNGNNGGNSAVSFASGVRSAKTEMESSALCS